MQFKKVLISFFLLFAYSIGLAHDFIPHDHEGEADIELVSNNIDDDHYKYHEHAVGEVIEQEHINHEDHLDDGVMDYLLCVLSESEHSTPNEGSCCYTPAKTIDFSNNWMAKAKAKFATLLFALLAEDNKDDSNVVIRAEKEVSYLSPLLPNAPHRGPPNISS